MRSLIFFLGALLLSGTATALTHWYVDAGAGGANNGTSAINAWTSMQSALTKADYDLSGNLVHVRRTHQETMLANWAVADDGAVSAIIHVLGDDGSVPAWSGDTAGIASFSTGAYAWQYSSDDYWTIENIRFEDMDTQALSLTVSDGIKVKDCEFAKFAAGASNYGVFAQSCDVTIKTSLFEGGSEGVDDANAGYGIGVYYSVAEIQGCSFDDTIYGIHGRAGGIGYIRNSSFGQEFANTTDIYVSESAATLQLYDCTLTDPDAGVDIQTYPTTSVVYQYYRDVKDRPVGFGKFGTCEIVANYDSARAGGAAYALAVTTPSADLGTNVRVPLLSYSVSSDSAETRSYSIWAKRDAAWGTAPADSQLYVEVVYQDGHCDSTSATLSTAATWTELSVASVSPNSAGPVLITLWLQTADTDGTLYVDPLLVATGETYQEGWHWGKPILAFIPPSAVGGQVILIN